MSYSSDSSSNSTFGSSNERHNVEYQYIGDTQGSTYSMDENDDQNADASSNNGDDSSSTSLPQCANHVERHSVTQDRALYEQDHSSQEDESDDDSSSSRENDVEEDSTDDNKNIESISDGDVHTLPDNNVTSTDIYYSDEADSKSGNDDIVLSSKDEHSDNMDCVKDEEDSYSLEDDPPPLRGKVLQKEHELSGDSDSDDNLKVSLPLSPSSFSSPISSKYEIQPAATGGDSVDFSSSDDELLVNCRTKKKKMSKKSNTFEIKPRITSGKKKKKSKSKNANKRDLKKRPRNKLKRIKEKNIVLPLEENMDVMASVVMDDNEENEYNSDASDIVAVAVAEVVERTEIKKSEIKSGNKKSKRSSDGKSGQSAKKKRGQKREKKSTNYSSDVAEVVPASSAVPQEKLEAAETARDILVHSIDRIPFQVSDTHVVRNFGRIKIENGDGTLDTLYSSPNSLHPIGFSCDRYEFSPLHGRIIKMRCDILDSSTVKRQKCEPEIDYDVKEEDLENMKNNEHTGPIFRIMWGQGIDESNDDRSFPFDLYSSSEPVGREVDVVAVPLGRNTVNVAPEIGMRVKVQFDSNVWYGGYVIKVNPVEDSLVETQKKETRTASVSKNVNLKFSVQIMYDDGAKEEALYPDPDIVLMPPGSEEMSEGCETDVREIHGKPVTTAIGKTPLEAWGQTLVKLGLIDETIVESSLHAMIASRLESIEEAKEKVRAQKKQRQEQRARQIRRQKEKGKFKDEDSETEVEKVNAPVIVRVKDGEAVEVDLGGDGGTITFEKEKEIEIEDISEREEKLKQHIETLNKTYEQRLCKSRASATLLTNARIASICPFLGNPFQDIEKSIPQQENWLATVVRKERAKMGSTGNKRKIVTASDLLERNTSFFNSDIERLVEGLLGTEFLPNYVFHKLRSNGAAMNQAWVHELQIREEEEQQRVKKRADEDKAKIFHQREKERKREEREEKNEIRKRQKMEELEEKKKAREEERLSRLSTQVDERLMKEACFQREKVTLFASKVIGKEVARRRRAAEIWASHIVEVSSTKKSCKESSLVDGIFKTDLPPLYKRYDGDVIRIWNCISAYKNAFCTDNESSIPTLEVLQNAVDCVRVGSEKIAKEESIVLLTNLAIMFCKPLASGLVKTTSSVLTTILQEKNEISSGVNQTETESLVCNNPLCSYPVNIYTWMEVARLVLNCDALNELGYSKQEQAHLLRGFRSGGHPNSKEAKRLRRGEDYAFVLRQQLLSEVTRSFALSTDENKSCGNLKVLVQVPSKPSARPTDWFYFLHNVKSLPVNAVTAMKSNIRKASISLKSATLDVSKGQKLETIASDLQRSLSILEQIGTAYTSSSDTISACNRARRIVLRCLDKVTGELYSVDIASEVMHRSSPTVSTPSKKSSFIKPHVSKNNRQVMGLVNLLVVDKISYKKRMLGKEEYMSAGIKLKEDLERKKMRASGSAAENDDDDDDTDDDEDDVDNSKKNNETHEGKEETDLKTEILNEKNALTVPKIPITIGKKTDFDDFCGDDPYAPELIRRCLAVLRTLCGSSSAGSFIYPVDPQTNPKYYEAILRPMSLYDSGKIVQVAGKRLTSSSNGKIADVEIVVAEFGRNVRLVVQNCLCFSNVGGPIISSAEEMIRIFERLFFDWVLAPSETMSSLEMLNDDRCVDYHPSDEESMVLLCDGCEGKFNMGRLDPPLESVPRGDWYCQRCLEGRCWATLDPRIGKKVYKIFHSETDLEDNKADACKEGVSIQGIVKTCTYCFLEGKHSKKSLAYTVQYDDKDEETWTLEMINRAIEITGQIIEPIMCLEAVAESPGYGYGTNNALAAEMLPLHINPLVSDIAAQKAVSSSVFQDTIVTSATLLLNDAESMTASEWLQLLLLLAMKCVSSDHLQDVVSRIENEANLQVSNYVSEASSIKSIHDVLPRVTDDEEDEHNSTKNSPDVKSPGEECDDEWDGNLTTQNNVEEDHAVDAKAELVKSNNQNGECLDAIVSNTEDVDIVIKIDPESSISTELVQSDSSAGRKKRQKAREECMIVSCIKAQIKPAITSFDEDNVTQVIEASHDGIDLASCQCLGISCDFCNLTDTCLGSPLVRVPNHEEWIELMPLYYRNYQLIAKVNSFNVSNSKNNNSSEYTRNIQSVKLHDEDVISAELVKSAEKENSNVEQTQTYSLLSDTDTKPPKPQSSDDISLQGIPNEVLSEPLEEFADGTMAIENANTQPLISTTQFKYLLVKVRVGDILLSTHPIAELVDETTDCGMVEFLPRNVDGFRQELEFCMDDRIPFITGSLSAHECCAISAHKARKEKLVHEKKETIFDNADIDCGNACGRTMSLGSDKWGRSYWKFHSDPTSLFVLSPSCIKQRKGKEFYRFSEPEAIASVMTCLGDGDLYDRLKKRYPMAWNQLKSRQWCDILQKRMISLEKESNRDEQNLINKQKDKNVKSENNIDVEPYREGEEVLVESQSGKIMWNANIIALSKILSCGKINGYRVHYKEWSSRHDEWVAPFRVVEPSEHNLLLQEELLNESALERDMIPSSLEQLCAKAYSGKPNRSSEVSSSKQISLISTVGPGGSAKEKMFDYLKKAILLVESALPKGSVDVSRQGTWKADIAFNWREMVIKANAPGILVGCLLLLENAISNKWLQPNAEHLLSCLPRPWKAVSEASLSSIALRLHILDCGINYDLFRDKSYSKASTKGRHQSR